MSSRDSETPRAPTPEEERAAAEVRSLGDPPIDDRFRAKLREQFVTGALDQGAGPEPVRPDAPRRPARIIPIVSFAAAALLALIVWTGTRTPHWQYGGSMGESGEVWICGMLMDPADHAGIDAMLHPGTPVRTTGEMQVDLVLKDRLSVQLAPEAEMTVPAWPARWFGGDAGCEVARGEVRFSTGPEGRGSRFQIRAPLATIEVHGTTFAVITGPDSTCVCVLEGEVRMTDPDGSIHSVGAGARRSVFGPDSSRTESIFPEERMKLEMLRDRPAGP